MRLLHKARRAARWVGQGVRLVFFLCGGRGCWRLVVCWGSWCASCTLAACHMPHATCCTCCAATVRGAAAAAAAADLLDARCAAPSSVPLHVRVNFVCSLTGMPRPGPPAAPPATAHGANVLRNWQLDEAQAARERQRLPQRRLPAVSGCSLAFSKFCRAFERIAASQSFTLSNFTVSTVILLYSLFSLFFIDMSKNSFQFL